MVAAVTAAGSFFYTKATPSVKHLGRDFILGAVFTGFLYPLIPDSFDDMKAAVGSASLPAISGIADVMPKLSVDPDVKVGPANF